ncbi:TetR/AcrR family transcriptional regulator [[Enterobacter] lignolyticus]|uniref:Regulatory protein TetR n=1 Tax=Enterobacter lignolyticus (strain SCF1) TaxID=701347 RepID=E3G8X6_ENTLS|nr:TetR/AcrR family transcriptional regulator [[Enterobacter] lignolyticus]ADO48697.1 regulatory protein TetR [[Enterobacter] lignolyticus SCF1]
MLKSPQGQSRLPSQKRGHKRVQQILDAAAEILSDASEPLTIKSLAARSGTAPGSLYHFFSDIESVKAQLKEEYDAQLEAMLEKIKNSHPAQAWATMRPAAAIANLFTPYANFIIEHKAYLPLQEQSNFDFRNSRFLQFIIDVLTLRMPPERAPDIVKEAIFLHALSIGTLQQAGQHGKSLPYDFIPRILSVLALYLENIEQLPAQ